MDSCEAESSLGEVLLCSWNQDGWTPVLSEILDFYNCYYFWVTHCVSQET